MNLDPIEQLLREADDADLLQTEILQDTDGDAELTHAVRFALFQLMGSVRDDGEAAVGARGVTGPGYRGHVFWDADVFVLPFLAATHPPAARAMLEYRPSGLSLRASASSAAARSGSPLRA